MNSNLHQSGHSRLQPNDQLREYRIIQLIGVGGMGAVYEAEHEVTKTKVAIKEILFPSATSDTESYQRLESAFLKEARLLMNLNPHKLPVEGALIPRAHTLFREGSRWYLLMDYIHGETLAEMLENNQHRPLPIEKIQAWLIQLLITLDYLHRQIPPLIHRDIKPANLKINEDGRLVLLDFGISKGGDSNTATIYSHSVQFYSPHYAPPEQLFGRGTDARSDLFAAAATMYTLLAGAPPPKAEARNYAKLEGEPDPLVMLNQKNRAVPTSLTEALQAGLALRPENRPKSAADMLDIILGYQPAPIPVDSTPIPRQVVRDTSDDHRSVSDSKYRGDNDTPATEAAVRADKWGAPVSVDKWGTPVSGYPSLSVPATFTAFPWLYLLMAGVGILMVVLIGWTLSGGDSNSTATAAPTERGVNIATQTAASIAGQPILSTSTPLFTIGEVSLYMPDNNASFAHGTSVRLWWGSQSLSDGERYAVRVWKRATPNVFQHEFNTTNTSALINGLSPTDYEWYVYITASDGTIQDKFSEVRSFSVMSDTPVSTASVSTPLTPTLIAEQPRDVLLYTPDNDATFAQGTGVRLWWGSQELDDGERYAVRVWKRANPDVFEREFNTRNTSALINGLSASDYEWHVYIMASNGATQDEFSEVRTFSVTSNSP